jgi:hypothetical protein
MAKPRVSSIQSWIADGIGWPPARGHPDGHPLRQGFLGIECQIREDVLKLDRIGLDPESHSGYIVTPVPERAGSMRGARVVTVPRW